MLNGRIGAAYVLALILDNTGAKHSHISLALCAGGLLRGKPEDEERGKKMLWMQTDAQAEAQQQVVNRTLLPPVMVRLLNAVLPRSETALVIRVIEIAKAAAPVFRRLYDWDAPVPTLTSEEMRQRGRSQARLLNNPLPPSGVPRVRRRVLMTIPQQRAMGLRLVVAMNSYGWQAEICPLTLTDAGAADDCRAIAEMCRQKDVDILFFDAHQLVLFENGLKAYCEMVAQLRQEKPTIKAVAIFYDSIPSAKRETLEMMAKNLDAVMSHLSLDSFVARNEHYAVFAGKMMQAFLIPCIDSNCGISDKPLVPRPLFSGTICSGHWTRVFWLKAAAHVGLTIDARINAFSYDNPVYKKSPLDDYAFYMKGLADATCCLNMIMLDSQERYLVARSFEIPFVGSLLIQEYSEQMHNYYIPGEHYLEYSTISELVGIMRFISENTEEAEEIRRSGNAFAREHYSDIKIAGQFDKFLYYPD
ncbi:MAG: glycosyltransferase [Magnetococcus sp. XQGC-1]